MIQLQGHSFRSKISSVVAERISFRNRDQIGARKFIQQPESSRGEDDKPQDVAGKAVGAVTAFTVSR